MTPRQHTQHLPSKNPKITLCGFDINPNLIPDEDAPKCRRCENKAGGTWTETMTRPLPNVTAAKHVWIPTQ
jgi:hypothetical protein